MPGYSHRMSEFGPIAIAVRSSSVSRTWSKWHRTRRCHCLRKSEKIASASSSPRNILVAVGRVVLTGVGNLLVVLDRLYVKDASVKRSEPATCRAIASAIARETCDSPLCRLWIKPSVPLVVEEITVVKRMQFGGRLLGGAPKFLAGLGNPMKAVCGSDSLKISGGGARAATGWTSSCRQLLPIGSAKGVSETGLLSHSSRLLAEDGKFRRGSR